MRVAITVKFAAFLKEVVNSVQYRLCISLGILPGRQELIVIAYYTVEFGIRLDIRFITCYLNLEVLVASSLHIGIEYNHLHGIRCSSVNCRPWHAHKL